jgi:hypothetical protein
MTARFLFGLLLAIGVAGCGHRGQTRYGVTLGSDQQWTIGEAKTCEFVDAQQDAMRCFTARRADSSAEVQVEHEYLVDAEFNKMPPVTEGLYGGFFTCRLDSFTHATCQVE